MVAAFDWDSPSGTAIVTRAAAASHAIEALVLAPGDVIELRGARDGGEPLRTDAIEILASAAPALGDSFVIEAEDLQILSGFSLGSNGAASGGQTLQSQGGGMARASYTVQQAGTFDLTVGYFDETDGVSTLQVLVNGGIVADFDWDATGGASIASTASRATHLIEGLELHAGDVIQLAGQGDGGEPLRVDYLEFTSVPASPPDLWYVRDGELHVALNDGSGTFTELPTGILDGGHPSEKAHYAVDWDGDGDLDFLEVAFPDPAAALPDPIPDELVFNLSAKVYENDGSGGFSEASAVTEAFSIPLDGVYGRTGDELRYILNFGEAGDLDNDGDIDFTATSVAGQELILFLNDGDDSFTKTVVPFPPEFTWGELTEGGADVYLSDINGDGILDLLFSIDWEFSNTLIMISDGAGGYDVTGLYGASDDGNGLQIPADLDGDGDLDVLFVAVSDGGGVYAYLSDGTGARQDAGGSFPSLVSGELNGVGLLQIGNFDGTPGAEMISASIDDPSVGLPAGLRVIDFVPVGNSVDLVQGSLDPAITGQLTAQGDFDGDGDLDLILTTETAGPESQVFLLVNDGAGNFTLGDALVPSVTGLNPYSFAYVSAGEFGDLPVV
ncbi:FG-GAP-like repeat-containing protein [Salipiger mangrovisoli]|uniref:FG-GAP-like repeat-containing protein n=1 Tax=Salipiger mangrovisoli TaxID=2865933 RepID=UPI001881C762